MENAATLLRSLLHGFAIVFGWLGVIIASISIAHAGDDDDGTLIIVGGSLIAGTGDDMLDNTAVYVRGGIIERIDVISGDNYPEGPNVISAKGKFLVPGLIESHAHIDHINGIGLTAAQQKIALAYNPRAFLYNGVTTLISMSSNDLESVQDIQRQAEAGAVLPRILTGGEHFTIPGGWGGRHGGGVSSKAEISSRMEALSDAGVDLIKIIHEDGLGEDPVFERLSPDLMTEVVRLGRQKGLPVFIHATDEQEYSEAAATGPNAIVHGLLTPLADDSPLVAELRERDITVIPTMVLFEAFIRFLDSPELLRNPHLVASVPDFVLESVSDRTQLASAIDKMNTILKMDAAAWARSALDTLKSNTRKFAQAGIPLAVGADSGGAVAHAFQGYNTPREMELLADCCLSPMETIVAASRNGAELFGPDQNYGTLEPGKSADILILNENPLTDMAHIRDFDLMILRGKPVPRSSLTFEAFMKRDVTSDGEKE